MNKKHAVALLSGDFSDERFVLNALLSSCWKLNLSIISKVEHKFYPFGYTAIILLGESHISIHTYPENNEAYCDCFTCGSRDPEVVLKTLAKELNAHIKSSKMIRRN